MQDFLDFLDTTQVFQNSLAAYATSLLVFLAGVVAIALIQRLLVQRLRRWAKRTDHDFDDHLLRFYESSVVPLIYIGTFYISLQNLQINPAIAQGLTSLCVILATIFGIRFIGALVEYGLRSHWFDRAPFVHEQMSLGVLIPTVRVVLWAIGIVFLLDNLGFDISAVVTGLGIGGVAIALASQSVLADLFSYFAVLFDRPFELGDFIIIGSYMGTVQRIGIKTTRLISLSGEELVFSNTDLTSSRVQNFKRMERRRVVFPLGITYETPSDKLKQIPDMIANIIRDVEGVLFDRAHFFSYGNSSLDFEVVYYVLSNDYTLYMDAQQSINFAIKEAFESAGIEFAYPTQTLYLNQTVSNGNTPIAT